MSIPTNSRVVSPAVGGATGPDAVPAPPTNETFLYAGAGRSTGCSIAVVVIGWLAVMMMLGSVNRRAEFLPSHQDGIQVAPSAVLPSPAAPFSKGEGPKGTAGDPVRTPFSVLDLPVPPPVWKLETEPFRRCALKVLGGEYGQVPQWKRDLYERLYLSGLEATYAKRTTYCPHCDPTGVFADGKRFALGNCAANPEIPLHAIIWTASDGFLTVRDRGPAVSMRYTRGRERTNIDVFCWDCPGDCWTGPGTHRNEPFLIASVP